MKWPCTVSSGTSEPCHFRWLWVTCEGGTREARFYRPISVRMLLPFEQHDQIRHVNPCEEGRVFRGQPVPIKREWGLGAPNFRDPLRTFIQSELRYRNKFGTATHMGQSCVSRKQPHPMLLVCLVRYKRIRRSMTVNVTWLGSSNRSPISRSAQLIVFHHLYPQGWHQSVPRVQQLLGLPVGCG